MQSSARYKWIRGGVASPGGFRAAGVKAGLKKNRRDLALIVSAGPAAAAGVFTRNRIPAAPVLFCRRQLKSRPAAQAIVVNSGNANACTGRRGWRAAVASAATAARFLKINPALVLVCSTGTIGIPLPLPKIKAGIRRAVSALARGPAAGGDAAGGSAAARAIMTTDTRAKQAAVRFKLDGKNVTIGAMAKGAGMIAPNLATLLVFITTDAAVKPAALRAALVGAVAQSFNRILVDGDQSTNDTALCLANGLAGNAPLTENQAGWPIFKTALAAVCRRLAEMIVQDGEGATRLIRLKVIGARTAADAEKIARAIAHSLLVKTSWFGADPNWGRVMAAIGYAGVALAPDKISIHYNGQAAVRNGQAAGMPPAALHKIIAGREFELTVNLRLGRAAYALLTCDCSLEYVKINAAYMT